MPRNRNWKCWTVEPLLFLTTQSPCCQDFSLCISLKYVFLTVSNNCCNFTTIKKGYGLMCWCKQHYCHFYVIHLLAKAEIFMAVTAFRSDVVVLFIVQFWRVCFFLTALTFSSECGTPHTIFMLQPSAEVHIEKVDYLLLYLHPLQKRICSEHGSLWLLAFSDLFYFSCDAKQVQNVSGNL